MQVIYQMRRVQRNIKEPAGFNITSVCSAWCGDSWYQMHRNFVLLYRSRFPASTPSAFLMRSEIFEFFDDMTVI